MWLSLAVAHLKLQVWYDSWTLTYIHIMQVGQQRWLVFVPGNAKGLSGLMSQYAQDSDTEDTDEDVDTSVYDVEAGWFNNNLIACCAFCLANGAFLQPISSTPLNASLRNCNTWRVLAANRKPRSDFGVLTPTPKNIGSKDYLFSAISHLVHIVWILNVLLAPSGELAWKTVRLVERHIAT